MFCHPFCLLSYSGTKSYQNLLVDVYGGIDTEFKQSNLGVVALQYPLSFSSRGFYQNSGKIDGNWAVFLWSNNTLYTDKAGDSDLAIEAFFVQYQATRGRGLSFRCLGR